MSINKLFNYLILSYLFTFSVFSKEIPYELAVACMFRDEAPYLKEWVEYHLMVGVEHFWLYDNFSTDDWQTILQPYIDDGRVEVSLWGKEKTTHGYPYQIQQEAFADSIKRSTGLAKWIAFIDMDEFIVPMKDKTVVDCLNNHYSEASGVFVNWLNFGTSGVYVPKGEPFIFRLFRCAMNSYPKNGQGKSILRPECVDLGLMKSVHYLALKPNFIYMNGDKKSIPFIGQDPQLDWKDHYKYIRINHYFLRDEGYYWSCPYKTGPLTC